MADREAAGTASSCGTPCRPPEGGIRGPAFCIIAPRSPEPRSRGGSAPSHPAVRVDGMSDDADHLTADDLDQLAQSLAVDGSLGRVDTLRVVEVLRALAAARRRAGH